jgi:hypothetical protein
MISGRYDTDYFDYDKAVRATFQACRQRRYRWLPHPCEESNHWRTNAMFRTSH